MSATPLAPLKIRRDAAGGLRAQPVPDRAPAIARAGTALAHLTREAARPGARAVDVQLVIDVCGAAAYPRWRGERENVWSAQGGRYGTGAWPTALAPRGFAAVLLPLPLDGVAAARTARVVAEPWFTSASGRDGRTPAHLATTMLADWLHSVGLGGTFRLAPPVLLTAAGRQTLDLGLRWPLPPSN